MDFSPHEFFGVGQGSRGSLSCGLKSTLRAVREWQIAVVLSDQIDSQADEKTIEQEQTEGTELPSSVSVVSDRLRLNRHRDRQHL